VSGAGETGCGGVREAVSSMTPSAPPVNWVAALVATLVIQTTSAFLSRLVPTIAPALTGDLAWEASAVGYLAAVSTVGSILFLIMGTPLILRAGPIRALQIGLLCGALGVALLAYPLAALVVLSSLLLGLGYGPSAPAGSDILQRTAPPAHRNLIFSVKQAGVPVGGVLAGLILPPITEAWGWQATLPVAILCAVATVAAVQGVRGKVDAHRDPSVRVTPATVFSLDNLRAPMRALAARPELPGIVAAAMGFAMAQGAWFAFLVTACVADLGMSLTAAGIVFAVMQTTGVIGRILLGWLSDRLGSGRKVLVGVALASSLTSLALALASPAWPYWALLVLAGVAGVTVSSWNGVQIAEVARLAAPGRVAETSSGATMVIFIGYVVGPAGFAGLVAATGRFDVGYAAAALATFTAFLFLVRRGARPVQP